MFYRKIDIIFSVSENPKTSSSQIANEHTYKRRELFQVSRNSVLTIYIQELTQEGLDRRLHIVSK